jgi:DNA excision repair protein ERCC-2
MIDDLGGDGFATTYIYPAMARSVQSAGRVVRTPKDRGLIILMDPRFLTAPYAESMPEDWTAGKKSPQDLVSQAILGDVRRFWGLPDSRV